MAMMISYAMITLLLLILETLAFSPLLPHDCNRSIQSHLHAHFCRRNILTSFVNTLVVTTATASNAADDRLFRPNPLTNPVLEQLRIWDQAAADTIKYDGVLEMGDAGNRGKVDGYPRLLVPILQLSTDLQKVQELVAESRDYPAAMNILQPYTTSGLKKMFNQYADNIYYSDPDRANIYLGGGATPKTEQSLAYLMRNDLLNEIDSLKAELGYIIKNPTDNSTDDLIEYASKACIAMKRYLEEVVPTQELNKAEELVGKKLPPNK
jgi:hypothetical protein